jgi:hypothetical protein
VLTGPLALLAYMTAALFIPTSKSLLENNYTNPIGL